MGGAQNLSIYLNDHLAAAIAGSELARRAARSNAGTALGAFLDELVEEVDADRRALEALMNEWGMKKNLIKDAAGWALEKAGRLKLNGRVLGYSPLSRVVELEGLALGIEGKKSLWRSVRLAGGAGGPSSIDVDELLGRAEEQGGKLEEHRLEAVQQAFGARRA